MTGVTANRYNNRQVQTVLLSHLLTLTPHYLLHVTHEFLYATMDITSVSAPRYMTYVVSHHFAAVQRRLIDTNKLTLKSEVLILWYRYRPSLLIEGVLGKW